MKVLVQITYAPSCLAPTLPSNLKRILPLLIIGMVFKFKTVNLKLGTLNYCNSINLMNATTELIKRLSVATGITGYTGPNNIQAVTIAELSAYVDSVKQDRVGSVIGLKHGEQESAPRHKIMLAAHLDEIGAIVTKIDKRVLRFTQVGGLDKRVLMGQEVMVHGQRDLPGVIGSIPPHLSPIDGFSHRVHLEELYVDVGLPPTQVEKLVQIGDFISFRKEPSELKNGLITGKALDNRVSMVAMIICLQQLKQLRHQWDVYAVATADEEWGNFTGATTQAYAIQPDVAIAIDVTLADVSELEIKLNDGPVISLGPSNHPVIRQRLLDICKNLELKYQNEVMPSGAGTDAFAIEISREGIPTILISVPSRYMHSPVEVVNIKDVERTGRLLAYFIASLDEAFIENLIPKSS